MINISSLLGCRNCQQSDGANHVYLLNGGNKQEYQVKTEFEVMTLIENWRIRDNKTCQFCGSSNVEVYEVEVEDYPLYNFNRLVEKSKSQGEFLFLLNFDKTGSEISMRPGGSRNFHSKFLNLAIQMVIETIKNRPEDNFIPQKNGNSFIGISGGFDFFDEKPFAKLERFRSSGLTKKEMLSALKPFAQQAGISVDI